MALCIDYMNFVMDYENGSPSDYWLDRYAMIDIENLEVSFHRYLDIVKKWFPTYSDKLDTFEKFQNRIHQYYDRKERGQKYFLDIVHNNSGFTNKDRLDKLLIHKTKAIKKNVGIQLNLNLFD